MSAPKRFDEVMNDIRDEDRRRLARYPEAIELVELLLHNGLEPWIARKAEAFLDDEPAEREGGV